MLSKVAEEFEDLFWFVYYFRHQLFISASTEAGIWFCPSQWLYYIE